MRKMIASMATVMFLAVVSGPAFAQAPTPAPTHAAKAMKHKKGHKKVKKGKKAKKAETSNSTPTAK